MTLALNELFSTSGVVIALLLAGLGMWRRPGSKTVQRFVMIAAVFYTLASVYQVPWAVSRLLALGYHRFSEHDVAPGTTAVVVLSGGAEHIRGWEDSLTELNVASAARVLETRRVFKLVDPAWIISSGGVFDPKDRIEPNALTMRTALTRLGVPDARIKTETLSRNTHEEAVIVTPMLRSLNVQQVILVTSEVHMRRSMGAFRVEGWNPVPAVAPDRPGLPRARRWLPHRRGLSFSAEVAHELAGLPYYWIRGWWR